MKYSKHFLTTTITVVLISLEFTIINSQENDNNNVDQIKFNLDNHILKDQTLHSDSNPTTFHYKEPKKINCYECHSIGNQSWLGTCTRKRFCTGLWCVKGPDEGGFFRGCMDTLPFLDHKEKCITYKDPNGIVKENCYCNTEFCNSSNSLTLSLLYIITFLLIILREDTVVNRKRARIKIKTDNNECRTLCISSVNVEFPGFFNPYPSQELIMEANILSFIKSNNVLVESPTGSGKTMALLSSTIGWLVKYKKEFLTSIENCLQHGTNKSNKEEYCKSPQNKKIKSDEKKCSVDECLNYDNNILIKSFNEEEKNSIKCTCMNEIKIYYSTRTHKQIAQVIKELKRLPYCYGNSNNIVSIKHTILSAKEHTCINSEVKRSSNISERCKEIDLDKNTKCRFKMNLLKKFDLTIRSSIGIKTSPVWDIEELVHYGEMFRVCSHFAASTFLRNDANIIFCPFNYIVDPIIRDTANINLKNSIVILDEAHNIESFCRSSSSFDFTEKEIIHSLNDVYLKKSKLIKLIKRNSSIEFKKEEDDIEVSEFTISYLNKYLEELNCIIEFFKLFLNWFKSFSIEVLNEPSKTNIQGRIFRTSEIMRSLVISKLIRYKNDLVELNRLKNSWIGAMGFADEDKNDISNSITDTNEKLKKLKINTLSIVCIEKFIYFIRFLKKSPNAYRIFYSIEKSDIMFNIFKYTNKEVSKFEDSSFIYKSNKEEINVNGDEVNYDKFIAGEEYKQIKDNCIVKMELWCLDPSLCFVDAFQDVHSIVLASGTLSPINSFISELGIKFEKIVQCNQIIPKEQIFASVISVGPKNNDIICTRNELLSHEKGNGTSMLLEIASLIVDICENVAKGVLVFFPSYLMLDQILKKLYKSNLMKKLKNVKLVLQEPRKTSDLDSIMMSYEKAIKYPSTISQSCTGAVMFAVFRGKFSEGIDFTDDLARCVISIGIPFPNIGDLQVKEKKDFNDKFCDQKKLLSGEEWYKIEAYRAMNQALGRCLRHRNDWGLIVMVDKRLHQIVENNLPDKNKISKWVVENIRSFNKYENFQKQMKQFIVEREDKLVSKKS